MRLHPITVLILLAIALRLAGDSIRIAADFHGYIQDSGLDDLGWLWPRVFASDEREVAQTLANLVTAAMVEGLFRVWRALRDQRLAGLKDAL